MLFYAGFFAYHQHAVKCVYKNVTGSECATCGLTRSFHHILTGDFKQAVQLNALSIQLFVFFAVQLTARIVLIFATTKNNIQQILKWDLILSLILFAVCFFPLIKELF